MIITASRISTSSGAGGVSAHVFLGPKNESIQALQGTPADLNHMFYDARAGGSKYALRHFKISPQHGMTSDDAKTIAGDLGKEFGFDFTRAVIIEHQKKRAAEKGYERHWHILAPEYDPIENRILDSHWMRPRHEKIARLAEARLGHEHVPGRWNQAVAHALAKQHPELSEQVAALSKVPRPESAYTAEQHQHAQRKGRNQPYDRLAVLEAWQQSDSPTAFAAALAEQGIHIRQGDKPGTWIAERDGNLIGAVHRLANLNKEMVAERLAVMEAQPLDIESQPVIGALAAITPEQDGLPDPPHPPPGVQIAPVAPPPHSKPEASTKPASALYDGGHADAQSPSQQGANANWGDVLEGPGEPPGPGAPPQEIQQYRAKLMAYEDKKAAAMRAAFQAQQGEKYHVVQSQAENPASTTGGSGAKTNGETTNPRCGKPSSYREADFLEAKSAKDNAQTAVNLLEQLTQPAESENPKQMDILLEAIQAILESQRKQEIHLERISQMLRPRGV